MKKILHKLLFATLLLSTAVICSQTALPGTIEVENGDLSQNAVRTTGFANYVGSGNGGSNNVVRNFRKIAPSAGGSGINGTIINHVTVTADGNYDFTFTYFRSSGSNTIDILSTNATGGSATTLRSFTLAQNNSTATTSNYGTQTVTNVALTTGINYITIRNTKPNFIDLDNVIVTASAAKPEITLTGSTPVNLIEGETYNDAGATAVGSDGSTDVSGSIVTVNPVDTATPGTYTVTYNVSDGGVAADEVTRTVVVHPSTTRIASQTGNWNATATWGGNSVPTSSSEVLILGDYTITVSDAQEASSIKSSGTINVNSGGALTVSGDVFLSKFDDGIQVQSQTSTEAMGTIMIGGIVGTLNSDQSTSTSDKRFAARRVLDNDKWYLLSSISSKQARVNRMTGGSDFKTNATPAYSIAIYNNANSAGSKYDYFSTTLTDSDEVSLGAGMSVSVNGDDGQGDPETTGMFEYDAFFSHGSSITVAIAQDATTSDAFNLLGNPYLSNLHGNDNADGTNNLLKVNTGVLAEETLWFWNADSSTWVTKNQSSTAFTVPPLTGFFVKSSAAGGNFSYTTAMETHTASGSVLSKSANQRFGINLNVSKGETNRSTTIAFIEGKTKAFDNGYDSSIFGGYASDFEVYTQLLESSTTKKLAIQSLPNKDYESQVIPVGVKVNEETDYTFSLYVSNLPKGYKVFLEDRLTNAFTRLDEAGSEYTATLSEGTEGRFFIHTKASVPGAESQILRGVSVFNNDSTLHVVGLAQGAVTVNLYNMLGKEVYQHSFVAKSVDNIDLPRLAKGVYIVKLHTTKGSLSKKIILN